MAILQEAIKPRILPQRTKTAKPYHCADYNGKNVILYFYPKDDTPGCTAEACNFRDNYQSMLGKGFEIISVSTDNEKSHKKFVNKYSLPFTLIADEGSLQNCKKHGLMG